MAKNTNTYRPIANEARRMGMIGNIADQVIEGERYILAHDLVTTELQKASDIYWTAVESIPAVPTPREAANLLAAGKVDDARVVMAMLAASVHEGELVKGRNAVLRPLVADALGALTTAIQKSMPKRRAEVIAAATEAFEALSAIVDNMSASDLREGGSQNPNVLAQLAQYHAAYGNAMHAAQAAKSAGLHVDPMPRSGDREMPFRRHPSLWVVAERMPETSTLS